MIKPKSAFVLFLAVLLLALGVLPAFANQLDQMRREQDALQRNIQQTRTQLRQLQQQETNLLREINLLENDIRLVEAQIRSLGNKISAVEGEISEAEAELAEAEARIEEMDRLLAVRLRAIHEHGQVSYLDVLFSSATFAEFLTRYNDLQLIIEEDRELLAQYRDERARILTLKEGLEGKRQDLLALRRENLEKKQELEGKNTRLERLVVAARSEIEAQEEMIRKLEAENKKLEKMIEELLAAQRSAGYRGTGRYDWPVPEFGPSWITSGFGYRINPITRRPGEFHGGIDIGIPHSRWPGSRSYNGNPVQVVAADSGTAHIYRMGSGYGNLVIIDHGAGILTVYAHNHDFLIADKTEVRRGQAIAIVGSTGFSTGPHLHFEVRVNGQRMNPLDYVR